MLKQEYDFYLADSDAGKIIHYGLRYQVYCLREKFEDPSGYPNYMEQDEYDEASAHFIVRSRVTREWLGAMRLIIAPPHKLPVNRFSSLRPANYSRRAVAAEASRLCTLLPRTPRSTFTGKPMQADKSQPAAYPLASNALQTSFISIGLIGAARQYCINHGILYCFFLISDPLARMLRRLGMEIEPVGSPCLHRGWRRPYLHNVKTGYEAMRTRSPELYKEFCRPTAYVRFSEYENAEEGLPLAACGGDHRPIGLASSLTEGNRKPLDPNSRERNEWSAPSPAAVRL